MASLTRMDLLWSACFVGAFLVAPLVFVGALITAAVRRHLAGRALIAAGSSLAVTVGYLVAILLGGGLD